MVEEAAFALVLRLRLCLRLLVMVWLQVKLILARMKMVGMMQILALASVLVRHFHVFRTQSSLGIAAVLHQAQNSTSRYISEEFDNIFI